MNIYFIASEDHKVFGIGQTTRSYEERHKDGDWAKFHNYLKARGEELNLIHWWEDVDIVDTEIHAWLKTQPGIRKYAEWFSHTTTLDVIENMIEYKFFTYYNNTRKELVLKPYQQEFVDKSHTDYTEFLLAAKCRAGKSVMVLSHIADKRHNISLVVSRFKSPSQSWINDVKTFDKFENMVTVSLSDKNWQDQLTYWQSTNKQIVLWSTVQGLVRKLDNLPTIDLLVYDEAHIGDKSSQFIKVRNSLSTTPCLKVSGTAYDQLWDTTESNRFVYDYFQEQIDVEAGVIDRPSMSVVLAKYQSDKYSEVYGDDPDAMKNLFLIENDQFVDEFLVKEFIAKFFDTNREIKPSNRLLYQSNHIYMCLPSVQACHLFQQLVDHIIPAKVVTGDTQSDADSIDQFVREHNRSLCLTYSANVLGVTQSLWDTVINCREGKSIQFWSQFAFRAGSGDHNWRVIDFVPTRALESLRETFTLAADLNPTLSEYEFTEFVPIYEWDAGFDTLDQSQVNDILASDPGNVVRLMTGGVQGMDLESLLSMDFDNFQNFDKEITKSVLLNDQANNGDGAKVRTSDMTPAEKTELQQKIKTVQYYLSLTPEVIFREYRRGNTITTIQDVMDCDSYSPITGDTGLLSSLLTSGVLSSQTLSRRVSQVSTTVSAMGTTSDTLEQLSIATGTQHGIPPELFATMANRG